jgi:hypothetical protein
VPVKPTVSFTVDDALEIAKTLGALAVAINPASAGAVAAVTGAAALLRNTVLPAIRNAHDQTIGVAEQATLNAESAAERVRVGAPPSTIN